MDQATITLIATQAFSFIVLVVCEVLRIHPSGTVQALLDVFRKEIVSPPDPPTPPARSMIILTNQST